MTCRHLERAREAAAVDLDGRQSAAEVFLCGWADNEPAALLDAPRWLQREALAGHLLNYPKDCAGCPCFEAQ